MNRLLSALKNTNGIFARAFELRNDPLLADIYEDITNIERLYYIGPEADRENLRKDMQNWAGDFRKAFNAARQKVGA